MKLKKRFALALSIVAVAGLCTVALAAKPRPPGGGGGGTGCPKDILCMDVWIPVQCANGVVYSNQCYADRACAPGPCVRIDGGPVEAE